MVQDSASERGHSQLRANLLRIMLCLLYVGALALLVVWESRERLEMLTSECDLRDRARSGLYTKPYRAFLGWASPEQADRVVTVAITADLDEIQSNLCLGRSYLADVVTALAHQNPAVIVIDKFYSPTACVSEPRYTQNLSAAIQALPMPVVIGESTNGIETKIDGACLVRKPQLQFASANVRHGLTRINSETERLPLRWLILPEGVQAETKEHTQSGHAALSSHEADNATPRAQFANSLALVAAEAYDPSFIARPRIQNLIERDDHAYANVAATLPRITTTQLLCSTGDETLKAHWNLNCPPSAQLPPITGRIAVIGAESATDEKTVLNKRMWGFDLQARYIQSLLAGDYLRSLPIAVSFILFALFVVLNEAVPTLLLAYRPRWKSKPFLCHAYPRRRYIWTTFWVVVLFSATTAAALALRFLPPLLAFGDILLIAVSRLVYFSAESAEHPFLHSHQQHKGVHHVTPRISHAKDPAHRPTG